MSFLRDQGPLGARWPCPVLVISELRKVRFSLGEADLIAYWGMLALRARVLSLPQGVLEPPRTSDCAVAVISKGPGFTGCEAAEPGLGRN